LNAYACLFATWGVVTIAFIGLLMHRVILRGQGNGWISMIDDEYEDRATRAQTSIEMRARNLACLISALGALSGILLLGILSFWVYKGIPTPPSAPWWVMG
jgi:hypothetical protein